MKLLRSDSPEVATSVASTRALAGSSPPIAFTICIASLPGVLIGVIAGLITSGRVGISLGLPIVIAFTCYMLWRTSSRRLNWIVAARGDQVFIRLFSKRGKNGSETGKPEIMVLDGSEILSMSIRTVDVFLYGPKPKLIEWLMIEPRNTPEDISEYVHPLPRSGGPNICGIEPIDPNKQEYVANEGGCLTMKWKWCRPSLPLFLQQVARECPSIVMGASKHSELDLNGIWHGLREKPNAEQRELLRHAIRLGFGPECVHRLRLHKASSIPDARAYLEEIRREEIGEEHTTL